VTGVHGPAFGVNVVCIGYKVAVEMIKLEVETRGGPNYSYVLNPIKFRFDSTGGGTTAYIDTRTY